MDYSYYHRDENCEIVIEPLDQETYSVVVVNLRGTEGSFYFTLNTFNDTIQIVDREGYDKYIKIENQNKTEQI